MRMCVCVRCAVNVVDGEMLTITKVSRLHMAPYLCVSITRTYLYHIAFVFRNKNSIIL